MSDDFGLLHTFRFELTFQPSPLSGPKERSGPVDGAFSECTGLEGTMEQKVIKEGGRNYGAVQRVGQVSFATVVLKRGISPSGKLVKWFSRVAGGDYGYRCTVRISLKGPPSGKGPLPTVLVYRLEKALPVKFKAADFNARANDVGIEELHLVHEGLFLESPSSSPRSS
jgi:phage tail-like protein